MDCSLPFKIEKAQNGDNFIIDTLEPIAIEKITTYKQRFIKYNEAPEVSPIPSEIVESWKRSKQKGVNPTMSVAPYRLKGNELNALLRDRGPLIQEVLSLIYNSVPIMANCAICVIDKDGVILRMIGNKDIITGMEQFNHCIGAIWTEESVGTTAHTLSMHLRKPVQLLLRESHYCTSIIINNTLASAAPLIDQTGEVMGAVVVVHWLDQSFMKANANNFFMHPLGWTIALAYSYHQQSKYKKQNEQLWVTNQILESGLSMVDYGLLTMDGQGIIRNVNKEGYKLLGLGSTEIVGKEFTETFTNAGWVLNKLRAAKPIHNFVTALNGKADKQFTFNLIPIINDSYRDFTGAIIKIALPELSSLSSKSSNTNVKYTFKDIIGESNALKKALHIAKTVAPNPGNVLLIGESGTGKELFAQSIHNLYRPEGPFIAINCASIPKSLIESELFGYEGGSFTGAERKGRIGKIELAQGGTLFLDEIGDMPLELQPVLLRVLEEKRLMRVGGNKYIPVDFRVIAATNKDLKKMVEDNNFRADLYYRLAILKISIPPLRQRREDIEILIEHLLTKICQKNNCLVPKLSPKVKNVLKKYSWPGNIRQLENVLIYAISLSQGALIELEHLPEDLITGMKPLTSLQKGPMSMSEVERQAIKNALAYTNNNLGDASRILGIGRTTLYRKMKEYRISPDTNC